MSPPLPKKDHELFSLIHKKALSNGMQYSSSGAVGLITVEPLDNPKKLTLAISGSTQFSQMNMDTSGVFGKDHNLTTTNVQKSAQNMQRALASTGL